MLEDKKSGEEKYKERQKKKKEAEAKTKAQVRGVGLKGGERIKTVSGSEIPEESKKDKEVTKKRRSKDKVRGKKYTEVSSKIDKKRLYGLADAIKLVKETSYTSFDGTVELHAIVKKKGLATSVNLPHSGAKKKKIEIADKETIKKLEKGKVDFDILLATADMMPKLVPHAKLLGPKGLMPNPKNGTLIKTKGDAKKFTKSLVTLKTERKAPLVHTVIGKVSQKQSELINNTQAVIDALGKRQVQKAYLTSTMGPSVKLDIV
ncbi:MAG: hypothetical protein ACC618_02820 [Patescibacteria group bacterium]